MFDDGEGIWMFTPEESSFENITLGFPAGEYLVAITAAGGVSTSSVTVAESFERPNETPVIVTPRTGVSWPDAYVQWNAPTNANFTRISVEVEDASASFKFEEWFDDLALTDARISGLDAESSYSASVGFVNEQDGVTANSIKFNLFRARYAEMEFTTGSTPDPTFPDRVSWYGLKCLSRKPGESWEFLDGQDRHGKGMTLQEEYVADTDPNNLDSVFRIVSVDPGPPMEVVVQPSSAARIYTLQRRADLRGGEWGDVPSQVAVPGGTIPLSDETGAGESFFYRVKVAVP